MDAKQRRKEIIKTLEKQEREISASQLAEKFSVSRQVIVGDVALLRAKDYQILATSRGYILESKLTQPGYIGKLVCFHKPEQTREELYTIVDFGGEILDVSIEHDIYGEISGKLGISSRVEVDDFLEACQQTKSRLLTELTDGVHIHSIFCKDEETFVKIKQALQQKGLLYSEE